MVRTAGGRRREAARRRRRNDILHSGLRWPEERQERHRTRSRQSCTWWSLAKQWKQPNREAGRDTVIISTCLGGAAEMAACR